jgi:hypothetical protein
VSPRTCAVPCPGIEAGERTMTTDLLVSADFCYAVVSRLDIKSATKKDTIILQANLYKQFMT